MNVLLVEPGKKPREAEIGSELEALQAVVGGNIEAVYPWDEPAALVCNEEGKLTGLPLNRVLRDENGRIADIVAGTFFICGLGDEDFQSLPPELIKKFDAKFAVPEVFHRIGGRLVVTPAEEARAKPKSDHVKAAADHAKPVPDHGGR